MMSGQPESGFSVRHEVRETPDKGLGVFAMGPIVEGHVVWRFVPGLYDVFDEAGFVDHIAGMDRDALVYEFTHSFGFSDFPTCVIRPRDAGGLINHATHANLATNFACPFQAPTGQRDTNSVDYVRRALQQDRFALIATRPIATGEELTNNYTEDIFDPDFFDRLYEEYGIEEDYLD
ncbi:MAG: SET domain-containing protein [Pseudomonadota bacterium]